MSGCTSPYSRIIPRISSPHTPDLIPSYPGSHPLIPRISSPHTPDLIPSYPGSHPLVPRISSLVPRISSLVPRMFTLVSTDIYIIVPGYFFPPIFGDQGIFFFYTHLCIHTYVCTYTYIYTYVFTSMYVVHTHGSYNVTHQTFSPLSPFPPFILFFSNTDDTNCFLYITTLFPCRP